MSDLGKDGLRIKKVCVKRYNKKELTEIYNISRYILEKKLKRYKSQIGEPDGYSYEVKQVSLIFRLIPLPLNVRLVQL